jgi:signal transduction histidine kinase/ActR/RegA family two-component response regulator
LPKLERARGNGGGHTRVSLDRNQLAMSYTSIDLEDLFEHAPCGYLCIAPDGRIASVNQTFALWAGAARDDLIGTSFSEKLHIAGRIYYETHLRPLLTMQGFVNEVALDFQLGTAPVLPTLVNLTERRDAGGALLYVRLTVFKATDRRRYERELLSARSDAQVAAERIKGLNERLQSQITEIEAAHRQSEELLRQAQKMEAIGQLTGGIAHDFNNLLMIIGGSLDMLDRRMADEPRIRRLFDAARQAVGRGARLNQQLLAFSRRQDLHMEVVQINDLVPAFEHLLDRAVDETVKVEFIRDQHLWMCRTDPHQLETAILNLAINARDAMPQGGRLVIRTSNRRVDDAFASQWGASAGEYATISVEDDGAGMSPEVLAHIFEPFFTTKDVGKGTGLGLSQVYGFVKQSGGFVAVKSAPGRGTLIEMFLKRSMESRATARQMAQAGLETGTGVVLVVEDDAAVRATTSGMLEDLGYSVLSADTGNAALRIIQADTALDLVFSDVVMPDGMSGVELARQIGNLRPELPILLTSGHTAHRVLPEISTGELVLLKKPFSQADLSIAIRNLMAVSLEAQRYQTAK